jgi:TIR domain
MTGIFISYRHKQSQSAAGRLKEHLREVFEDRRILMDVASIAPGDKWREAIMEALSSSEIVLAVVGKDWARDFHRARPIGEPDYVREELSEALAKGLKVLPVRVDDAPLPKAHQLPSELQALLDTQDLELTESHYGEDFKKLVAAIGGAHGIVELQVGRPPSAKPTLSLHNEGPFVFFVDGVPVSEIAIGKDSTAFSVPAGRHTLQAAITPRPQERMDGKIIARPKATPHAQHGPDGTSYVPSEPIAFERKGGQTIRFGVLSDRSRQGLERCLLMAPQSPVRP